MKNAVGRDIPEALLVNGKEVYQGSLASVPDMIRFKQDGGGWKA